MPELKQGDLVVSKEIFTNGDGDSFPAGTQFNVLYASKNFVGLCWEDGGSRTIEGIPIHLVELVRSAQE
jgi:hypothetical protein